MPSTDSNSEPFESSSQQPAVVHQHPRPVICRKLKFAAAQRTETQE
jgi:hypothetical protein